MSVLPVTPCSVRRSVLSTPSTRYAGRALIGSTRSTQPSVGTRRALLTMRRGAALPAGSDVTASASTQTSSPRSSCTRAASPCRPDMRNTVPGRMNHLYVPPGTGFAITTASVSLPAAPTRTRPSESPSAIGAILRVTAAVSPRPYTTSVAPQRSARAPTSRAAVSPPSAESSGTATLAAAPAHGVRRTSARASAASRADTLTGSSSRNASPARGVMLVVSKYGGRVPSTGGRSAASSIGSVTR